MTVDYGPTFDMNAVLGDRPVFLKGRDGAVGDEFAAAVVVLGGWGKHFDDEDGVRQGVVFFEFSIATGEHKIGVRVKALQGHMDA